MASVLKEKRLALGKDLSEIVAVTRVRASYLHAIEDEQYGILPIPVYARGYIRDYAKALDVDPAVALGPYEQFIAGSPKEAVALIPAQSGGTAAGSSQSDSVSSPGELPRITLTAEREIQLAETTSGRRSVKLSLAFFLVLLIVGSIVLYRMFGASSFPGVENPKPDVILKEPVVIKPGEEQAKPADAQSLQSSAAEKPGPQQASPHAPLPAAEPLIPAPAAQKQTGVDKKHQIVLTAVEKVWVQIILDRVDKKEMLMNPGEVQRFDAKEVARLWIGNAAGLKISFDGREIAHGGKSGQSLRLVLPEAASPPLQTSAEKPLPNASRAAQ